MPDPDLLWAGHSCRPMSWHQRGPSAPFAKGNADQMKRPGLHAIAADHVFDGTVVRERTAVIVDGAHIVDLVPTSELPRTMSIRALPDDAWLAPGFIGLQGNGGGAVLFNGHPTVRGAHRIAAAHGKFGTTGVLPTLIRDSQEKMRLALDAANAAVSEEAGILGVHI